MHPTDEELMAWLDGELDERDERRVREHVERCEACRPRRYALEHRVVETGRLLGTLDRPPPPISADDVISIAERRHVGPGLSSRRALWAAVIAFLLIGGATLAAVLPGSPLRDAVRSLLGPQEPAAGPAGGDVAEWGQGAGVALVPAAGLEVSFESGQSEGSIELETTASDTARVEVRGDTGVGLVVGDRGVGVANQGATASYRITLPLDLPTVLIRVGPLALYRVVDGRVITDELREDRRISFQEIRSQGSE